MVVMNLLVILLFIGLGCAYTVPQCSVYCDGEILHAIQQSGIYADSKTFVDMPMKYDPDVIIENFKKIESHTIPNLSKFLRENFFNGGF